MISIPPGIVSLALLVLLVTTTTTYVESKAFFSSPYYISENTRSVFSMGRRYLQDVEKNDGEKEGGATLESNIEGTDASSSSDNSENEKEQETTDYLPYADGTLVRFQDEDGTW